MRTAPVPELPHALDMLLQRLALLDAESDLPDPATPAGRLTAEFFESNWQSASEGLLSRTDKIRIDPQPMPTPYIFRFEMDVRFKTKRAPDGPVELCDGPLLGTLRYRTDLFTCGPDDPSFVVMIDTDQALYHPNHSRRHGLLCCGGVSPGPFPLELLLQHLYSIVSYGHWSVTDPADPEAAAYFARDPDAMSGLQHTEPLF
jgi:hypothetical protein